MNIHLPSDQKGHDSKSQGSGVGYVVKRYPRFSETFIVNEILAHEQAGADIEIFALRPPIDTHFQTNISQVRAPVHYLTGANKSHELWAAIQSAKRNLPNLWKVIDGADEINVGELSQAIDLAIAARQRAIRHLHAHFATSATTVARLAAQMADISYSITMHAKDIFHESVQDHDLQQKISDARFIITVSDFNRQFLAEKFGGGHKIYRVYNGLDMQSFPYRSPVHRTNQILAIGRLVPKKGFSVLISACRILADRNLEFTCNIVGSGELAKELDEQVAHLNLTDRIRLVGPLPQNEVKKLIHQSTVVAVPCVISEDGNRDGLPTVLTESMALGTPCVSTDVTGIPEILEHEVTGLLVRQGSAGELADALARLFTDGRLRTRLSVNARRLVEREFDIHRNVASIRQQFPIIRRAPPNRLSPSAEVQTV